MESTNNFASVSGRIVSPFSYSHSVYGEGFYNVNVEVRRLSDNFDILPVTVSERLTDVHSDLIGEHCLVNGQIRSYNSYAKEDNRNHLILTVFASDFSLSAEAKNPNEIILNGFICKPPIYRKTPFGREITDILLAVNRSYNKSDYIPCICWGRNARYAGNLSIGEAVRLQGRMQSRVYQKRLEDGSLLDKVAYEVSVWKLE